MAGQWDAWLAALKAAGKGGQSYPQLTIDRGLAYSKTLAFGMDLSGDIFAASLRSSPDGPELAPPINFTVTVGAFASGITPVTIELTPEETADIPADSDLDGVEEFPFDMLRNDSRFIAGLIPVAGKVTGTDVS